jgi:AraC-like DNA-binding protein/mannose-6-phosphate isomerase-like protein (cupin superfamily)
MHRVYPKQFLALDESVNVRYSEDPVLSSISVHSHNYIEFSYLMEGSGTETINHAAFEMKPGYFSIIYPWQTHELRFATDRIRYYFIAISMDNFMGAGSVALELKDLFLQFGQEGPSNFYFNESDMEKLAMAFREMHAEYTTRRKWWELTVKSRMLDILILFDRRRNAAGGETEAQAGRSARQQTMEILFYIYNNFKEDMNLKLLSKHFGLSQNYLSTVIKASLGLTFSDFIQHMRLKYACSLLASTSMPVTDIAYATGYQSYRNFVRFFKKAYAMSPSQYRGAAGPDAPRA